MKLSDIGVICPGANSSLGPALCTLSHFPFRNDGDGFPITNIFIARLVLNREKNLTCMLDYVLWTEFDRTKCFSYIEPKSSNVTINIEVRFNSIST